MEKTLIKNGRVLDLKNGNHTLQKRDILIEGKHIRDMKPHIQDQDVTNVIDAEDKIVMPGFVDTHRHVWESILRHIGTDWTLVTYLESLYYNNLGAQLTPEDSYIANLWGALEALDAGVTTLLDYSMLETPEHADACIKGLQDAHVRGVFAHGPSGDGKYWSRDSELRHPEDSRRVKAAYFQSDDQLLTMALGIRGPEFSAWETAVDDIQLARELDCIAAMHIGFGTWGPHDHSIQRLYDANLLGPDLNLVHVNTVQDHEYKLIAETGASVSVTPEVEMMMGHGYPITGKVHKHDGLVTLGVDVVVSTAGDMFSQMKFALQAERAIQNQQILESGEMPQELQITTDDMLQFAIPNGAKALGLDHKIGTLEVGKEADIIFVDPGASNLYPLNDQPVGAIVQSARPENVDSVFVAGKAVKRNGKLLVDNLEEIKEKVRASSEAVFERQERKVAQG
ncbi:amidohydrolase family protein [Caldalkalibacillus salinus]|uniref:amidohydrolase family protein n=1 Tax=Caldalkalibacillus salinus TaxID=2803787 RepID=UPI0019218464|nr:amidohydrolase family protein [Caldalkalibacillus salinus]